MARTRVHSQSASHRPLRGARFRALVAVLALLAQAVVPFAHAWECSEPARSSVADSTPSRQQLSAPTHECDTCPICKAVREASRPGLDAVAPVSLVLAPAFFLAAPTPESAPHAPVTAALARGPPAVL
jgi:hypothetical protein